MFPCWLLSPSYYFVCQMNASLLSHANIDHHNTESRIQDVYHFALFQCIPGTHLDMFDYKHLHPREVWLHAVFCLPAASLSDDFQHWSSIYKKKNHKPCVIFICNKTGNKYGSQIYCASTIFNNFIFEHTYLIKYMIIKWFIS